MILQGYADKRAAFWDQGVWNERPQTFAGAVPREEAEALFDFDVAVLKEPYMSSDELGTTKLRNRQVFVRTDTNTVVGVHGPRRKPANYTESLLNFSTELIGDDSGISSVGLLNQGEIAWIQVSLRNTYGVDEATFQPYLAIADSNSATGGAWRASQGGTLILCSNTLRGFFGMAPKVVKKVHRGQPITIESAREQLELLHAHAQRFESLLDQLLHTEITSMQVDEFMTVMEPDKSAAQKRSKIMRTYLNNPSVRPFKGTAFGLIQAVNTNNHWNRTRADSVGQKNWESNFKQSMFDTQSSILSDDAKAMTAMREMGLVSAH